MKWDDFYRNKDNLNNLLINLANHNELINEIIREKPKRILEIGVGTGIMGIFLSWLNYKVMAIDINKKILTNAILTSKKLNGKVKFIKCDAFSLKKKFKKKYFDVCFSQGFFEHFNNEEIIKLIEEQLFISKCVIISVPSKYYLKKDFGNERLLDVRKWEKILNNFNFDVKYYGKNKNIKRMLLCLIRYPSVHLKRHNHILIKIKNIHKNCKY